MLPKNYVLDSLAYYQHKFGIFDITHTAIINNEYMQDIILATYTIQVGYLWSF